MKSFDQLPLVEGRNDRHAWEEFGAGDALGSLNLVTSEKVAASARLVRKGHVFSLDLPLDEPGALSDLRPTYRHQVKVEPYGRDDSLDGFFLSASSQWDGLRHVRYREHGYYGGRQEADLDSNPDLGIDGVAEKGFVTRGVLVDIPRYMQAQGLDWDPLAKVRIGPDLLDAALARQSTTVAPGDVLLLVTGWLSAWMARNAEQGTTPMEGTPGLAPGRETAAWLWDRGVVAVAADNVAVEPVPFTEKGDGQLHFRLLPLLGIMMGELFKLDWLAEDCQEDGVYEGLFVSAPLKLPRGVCSPPNAYLIK